MLHLQILRLIITPLAFFILMRTNAQLLSDSILEFESIRPHVTELRRNAKCLNNLCSKTATHCCSEKFRKTHGKTSAPESLSQHNCRLAACNFIMKEFSASVNFTKCFRIALYRTPLGDCFYVLCQCHCTKHEYFN